MATDVLSPRQLEVLLLVAYGFTSREIGERLGVTEETVKTHLRWIFGRLSARNRAHAVGIGYRDGLLPIDAHPPA